MFVSKVEKLFKSPIGKNNRQNRISLIFWFSLSLFFACFYIQFGIRQGFSSEYVIGDNAREYIPWMYRYSNPELFPNDLIADYFQSVTPIGYAAIYRLTMSFGIDPIVLSKVLPILLGLVATAYCFAVCMQILPVPIAGFLATLILNQSLGLHDDLFSACPRDFTYSLFLAFLYYLMRGSAPGVIIAFTLQALIYPLIAFVELGILFLRLCSFSNMRFRFSQRRLDYILFAMVLAAALITITPYALQSSEFGPSITTAIAKTMPDYFRGGRVSYYNSNIVSFWLDGRDSGIFALLNPPQLLIGLLLPIILRYQSSSSNLKITKQVKVLLQVVLASTAMFFIAHALSFKLHFPSRYTHHTFKMVLALAAGTVLAVMLDAAFNWARQTQANYTKRLFLTYLTITIVGAALVLYPTTLKTFPKTPYVVGSVPTLYKFLSSQPPNSLVASLAGEADNIPPFAKRPILVGKEYALPFHTKYYAQFSPRMTDLINAQYNQDISQVINFIDKYDIKYWLLERNAFQPKYINKNTYIQQYQPAAKIAYSKLLQGSDFVLPKLIKSCTAIETENLFLLKAECIKNTKL